MRSRLILTALLATALLSTVAERAEAAGKLKLNVVDSKTGKPVGFRLHLRSEKGIPVKIPQQIYWVDHASVNGSVQLELFRGNYFFEIDHGPEFLNATGHFTINDGADDEKTVEIRRAADLPAEGWWSADLDVRRPQRELEAAMAADDVHLVPLTTWSNRKSDWQKTPLPKQILVGFDEDRYFHWLAGYDDRSGGPIAIYNLSRPAQLSTLPKDLLPLLPALTELKDANPAMWLDVAHPNAWDLPILLALGKVDSYRVLPSYLQRTKVDFVPQGKPFDKNMYLGLEGPARFAADVYFHMLNCGLRVVPSAGSGSGVAPNPVGYNRVCVHLEAETLSYDAWWESYRRGRATVSNGPLVRPRTNGQLPGFQFAASEGETLELDLAMNLTTRDIIDYVDVIQNGRTTRSVRLRDWVEAGGHFPTTTFTESGWCLVQARCVLPNTYRMAMSAPWYVVIGGKERISKASAQFFLDWLEERAAILKIADDKQRAAAEVAIAEARVYWQKKVADANAP
ncbi:MAG: hypothetical protein QM775_15570 [Pirellulales bacterium]